MESGTMKLAFVVLCCSLVAFREVVGEFSLPPEIVDLLTNLSQTCKEESGVEQSVVDELRKAHLVDEPKAKCYLKCVMSQLQALKDDGTMDIELIEATMPDVIKSHGGLETVHKCKHIHDADLCETAYQLMVCFKKENPDLAAMFE